MAKKVRLVLAALGWATLLLLPVLSIFLSHPGETLYHLGGSAAVLYLSLAFYVCLIWLVLSFSFLAIHSQRIKRLVWSAVGFSLPWIATYDLYHSFSISRAIPPPLSAAILLASTVAFCASNLFWSPSWQHFFTRFQRLTVDLLSWAGVSGLFTLAHLAGVVWLARNLNRTPVLHPLQVSARANAPTTRIIWIVFDELSYEQVFEHRYPGLKLEAFDALAAQATLFTHAQPAGDSTEYVLPSLITGIPVDRISVSVSGRQLSLHDAVRNSWQPFDARQSVFQDARNAGLTTNVAGWYNPYCDILSPVLDRCAWSSNEERAGLSSGRSLGANLLEPWLRALNVIRNRFKPSLLKRRDLVEIRLHTSDYQRLAVASDDLLADPHADFVFLHLPIPHPPGIFDRGSMTLLPPGSAYPASYVDNLALVDQYLAHIHALLAHQGQWNSAAVVVMGDHSWRTLSLWVGLPGWTQEDQAASQRPGSPKVTFDDRPAYLVKLPNQTTASRIDQPFDAVRTRNLLDVLIGRQARTPEDLRRWAAQQ